MLWKGASDVPVRWSCFRASGFVLLVALAACADHATRKPPPDPCNGDDRARRADGRLARTSTIGTMVTWTSNPPTSGPHYPVWAAYDQHYEDLARGYWLHDLEHGAVVYAYRCDAGCPDVAAQLDAIVKTSRPTGPAPRRSTSARSSSPIRCCRTTTRSTRSRGASSTAAQCADPATLEEFYYDHAASGPEDTCGDGATLGGTPIDERATASRRTPRPPASAPCAPPSTATSAPSPG